MKYFRHAVVVVVAVTLILSVMAVSQNRVPGVHWYTTQSTHYVGEKEKIQDGIYRMQTRITTMVMIVFDCQGMLTIDLPFTGRKGEPHVVFFAPGDDVTSMTEADFRESIVVAAPEYLIEPIKEGLNPKYRHESWDDNSHKPQ